MEIAGNGPGGGELAEEAIELGPSGKLAHPQQMGDFLEAGLARELVDVVAAIREPAIGAVQVAQLGLGRDHAFEAADQLGALSHARLLSGRFGSHRHGQIENLGI